MSASSEDIIRHIIRDIVAQSTGILKKRRTSLPPLPAKVESGDHVHDQGGAAAGEALRQAVGDDSSLPPVPPMTPLPQVKHLFAAGIKSHHTPYTVSDTLAAFVVRAVVLDPRNDFRIERELSKEEVQRLISMCVEKITELNSPVMETVKMQVYFDTTFPAQADYLHREKMSRIASCSGVLREITEIKTKNVAVYEVSYILLKSYVGSPTDIRIIREATAALESVFPQSELSAFISLSRGEKEAQLNGLSQLVTGIRLFNKQLGKGGEAVDDVIELCASELQELTSEVGIQTAKTEDDIQLYLATLDSAAKSVNPKLNNSLLERVRSTLVFKRQYLMYLDALQEQLERTRQSLSKLGENFDEIIRDLKSTCKAKTAVPVDQVYCFEVTISEDVVESAAPFRKEIEPEILPEADIIMKASELMAAVAIINKTVEVIHPGNTTQYFKLPVEYGGFCPYTLIRRDGVVTPGDKNLGLLRYRDRLFAFSNSEAAREFSKYPDRYMEGVLEMAKKMPDLVQLLHLYSYFPTVDALENAKSFTRQRLLGQMPMVSEAGTQVDTHINDNKMDSKYQWNEWELRRQALMLVNLKTKKTHSSQTALSHFRRESETQHYAPKLQATQTTTESSTNVPRRVNYMAGLRNDGKAKNKFKVVDLTVDI
ncbi:hypothetical protein HDU67_000078 [Dinochytrium kinnereticum]|nr:hypothetical protein HDU67_000078 [Dinochytrium kinnereticum]